MSATTACACSQPPRGGAPARGPAAGDGGEGRALDAGDAQPAECHAGGDPQRRAPDEPGGGEAASDREQQAGGEEPAGAATVHRAAGEGSGHDHDERAGEEHRAHRQRRGPVELGQEDGHKDQSTEPAGVGHPHDAAAGQVAAVAPQGRGDERLGRLPAPGAVGQRGDAAESQQPRDREREQAEGLDRAGRQQRGAHARHHQTRTDPVNPPIRALLVDPGRS